MNSHSTLKAGDDCRAPRIQAPPWDQNTGYPIHLGRVSRYRSVRICNANDGANVMSGVNEMSIRYIRNLKPTQFCPFSAKMSAATVAALQLYD